MHSTSEDQTKMFTSPRRFFCFQCKTKQRPAEQGDDIPLHPQGIQSVDLLCDNSVSVTQQFFGPEAAKQLLKRGLLACKLHECGFPACNCKLAKHYLLACKLQESGIIFLSVTANVRNKANFKKCGPLFSYGEQINTYHVFVFSLYTNIKNMGYFCADVRVAVYLLSR